MKRVRIEVPATSANLGPGFDCLGVALDLCDTVLVELDPEHPGVELAGVSGTDTLLHRRENLLCRAYTAWQEDTGTSLPGARFTLESRIPMGRGLGSSAAGIVAGLAAAAFAAEDRAAEDRILRLAAHIEGHPDNVTPAVLGGMTVAFCQDGEVRATHVANHLALGVALYVPDEPLATSDTRAALPTSIPMSDAVFNLGRLAYLVTALQWGRWEEIGCAMRDRLHQPYRSKLIPALDDVIAAALDGGAYGAALSGAGPSVIALGPLDRSNGFGAAMRERAHERSWPGRSIQTTIRRWGVVVRPMEGGT